MRVREVKTLTLSPRAGWIALAAGLAVSLAAVVTLGGSGGSAGAGERPWAGGPDRLAAGQHLQGLRSLPIAAQTAASTAIGSEQPAFRARPAAGGFRLGGGGVAADLGARGIALRAGGVSTSITVAGVGRGVRLDRSKVLSVDASANRVSLDRGALTEWYAAGPLGIEQGFALSRRPEGTAGPVTIALKLDGGVHASQARPGTILLTRPGQAGLRYGGLSAVDANGRTLRSALELGGDGLRIRVWDRGASYPLLIDPLIQQGGKLTGSGEVGAGSFGTSAALSADGNTALIGAPDDNGSVGAAWVFTRTGTTWSQQAGKLTGGGEAGAGTFGYSVSLSADGNTALIGGYNDNNGQGAAWVFTRTGTTWSQQGGKLTGGGEVGAGVFGVSVSLSADGNNALIGGPDDNNFVGSAWVFTRSGATWTQQGSKFSGSGANGQPGFGASTGLSTDGNTALIGGPFDNAANEFGAVWFFTRAGATWTQQGPKLVGSGVLQGNWFAYNAALSSDGNTAVVGGFPDLSTDGAAWVFARSGSTWSQQARLVGTGVGASYFGYGVATSADGNTALIGGPTDTSVGSIWVFTRSGATWTQQGNKLNGSGASGAPNLGSSVALSSDANTGLAGGPADNGNVGAVWVFAAPPTAPGAPTNVLAVADDGSAVVSWLPPASDGGSAITGYVVTPFIGAVAQTPIPVGLATSTTVMALTNGTTYTFRVAATNAVGTGPVSAASNAVTPIVQVRPLPDPPPATGRTLPPAPPPAVPRPPVPVH